MTIQEEKDDMLSFPSLLLTSHLSQCERYETYVLYSRDGRLRFVIGTLDTFTDVFSHSIDS